MEWCSWATCFPSSRKSSTKSIQGRDQLCTSKLWHMATPKSSIYVRPSVLGFTHSWCFISSCYSSLHSVKLEHASWFDTMLGSEWCSLPTTVLARLCKLCWFDQAANIWTAFIVCFSPQSVAAWRVLHSTTATGGHSKERQRCEAWLLCGGQGSTMIRDQPGWQSRSLELTN